MVESDVMKRKRSVVAWFVALAIVGVSLSIAIRHAWHEQRLAQERRRVERLQAEVERVKNGDSRSLITDSKLLPMLASDADCRDRVTHLYFASTDIDPTDAKYLAELRNITSITFYCSRGTKEALVAARTLPIASIYFEMPDLSSEDYLILKDYSQLKGITLYQVVDDTWIERLKAELPKVAINAPFPRSKEP